MFLKHTCEKIFKEHKFFECSFKKSMHCGICFLLSICEHFIVHLLQVSSKETSKSSQGFEEFEKNGQHSLTF